jgi:hypothetical protein
MNHFIKVPVSETYVLNVTRNKLLKYLFSSARILHVDSVKLAFGNVSEVELASLNGKWKVLPKAR